MNGSSGIIESETKRKHFTFNSIRARGTSDAGSKGRNGLMRGNEDTWIGIRYVGKRVDYHGESDIGASVIIACLEHNGAVEPRSSGSAENTRGGLNGESVWQGATLDGIDHIPSNHRRDQVDGRIHTECVLRQGILEPFGRQIVAEGGMDGMEGCRGGKFPAIGNVAAHGVRLHQVLHSIL